MNFKKLFSEIPAELKGLDDKGKIASYIPELGNVDPGKFGIHLTTVDNKNYSLGDSDEKFSIQSIAKVLSLTLAFKLDDDKLWDRVGVEPSGTAFNSLVQLEYEKGIPRNPFINAGALVICDILVSRLKNPKQDFLEFIRNISGNTSIDYCLKISESEKRTGFRNAALINFMKDYGNIKNSIEIVLDFYFNLCSIEMSCKEMAQTFSFLAFNGVHPKTKVEVSVSASQNELMQSCSYVAFTTRRENFLSKLDCRGKVASEVGSSQSIPGNTALPCGARN